MNGRRKVYGTVVGVRRCEPLPAQRCMAGRRVREGYER